MDMAGALQETRDTDSMACNRSPLKLNVTPFLTLPPPLDCLICAKDIMILVLLLQRMGE